MTTAHTFVHEDSESTEEPADPQRHEAQEDPSVPPDDLVETREEAALFGQLTLSDRKYLVECRVKVKFFVRTISKTVFEIGDMLNFGKAKLPHGSYQLWVQKVLGLPTKTSQNYSRAAEIFVGEEREIISHLGPAAIYSLCGDDPRLVEARTRLVRQMKFGLRLKNHEVEELVAAALGKSTAKAQAKAKRTQAEPVIDSESQVSDRVCDAYNVETEHVVTYIFEPFKERADELMTKLKRCEEHFVVGLLISKCMSHLECVDTPYEPLNKLRIEDVGHGTVLKPSSEPDPEDFD